MSSSLSSSSQKPQPKTLIVRMRISVVRFLRFLGFGKEREGQDRTGESGNVENNQGGGDEHKALLGGEQGPRRSELQEVGVEHEALLVGQQGPRRSELQEVGVQHEVLLGGDQEAGRSESQEVGVDRRRAGDFRLGRLFPPRVVLLLCLVFYILLWFLVYACIRTKKESSFIEALYFMLVTIFTVGFGDVKPNSDGTKWVSVILILVGVGFVDFGSNMVLNWMIIKLETLVLGRKLVLTVGWKAICSLIALILCVFVTAAGAFFTESLSITDAVYLSIASLTTLGYGDLKFQTDHAMLFCVLWLPLGILISSKALLCLAQLGFSWCRLGVCETTLLFTSQSVTQGHPDKICDVLVDAIVDVCLEKDPESRVLCEACIESDRVTVFGKVKMKEEEWVHLQEIINTEIGCTNQYVIENKIEFVQQFEDSYQGSVFGYATNETPQLMPLTQVMASELAWKLTQASKNRSIPWLKPSGKVEVTVEYRDDNGAMVPLRVHHIFISTEQHVVVSSDEVRQALMTPVIEPAIPHYRDASTTYNLSCTRLVTRKEGVGLSGRRSNADTYGGWGATLDMSLSGKDPNHVERYGAYIARKAAKSVVGSRLARRCCIQLSYEYGHPKPLLHVDTFSTGIIPDKDIISLVESGFDFTHPKVISCLGLKKGRIGGKYRYRQTAIYGHFGRDNKRDPISEGQDMFSDFTWEIETVFKLQNLRERLRTKTEFSLIA